MLDKSDHADALLVALRAGRVDGLTYYGECTIARASGIEHDEIPGVTPDAGRPAERWFTRIRPGHVPDLFPVAALTWMWVEEFIRLNFSRKEFPK